MTAAELNALAKNLSGWAGSEDCPCCEDTLNSAADVCRTMAKLESMPRSAAAWQLKLGYGSAMEAIKKYKEQK